MSSRPDPDDWPSDPDRLKPPVGLGDDRLPPVQTGDGLALPLPRISPGYFTITRDKVAFELWFGGDSDATVHLRGVVELRLPDREIHLDARSEDRSTLSPLLELQNRDVTQGRAASDGTLLIDFDGSNQLRASPGEDRAWEVTWPLDSSPVWSVKGRGRSVQVEEGGRSPARSATPDPGERGRVANEGGEPSGDRLPIRGEVRQLDISSTTVELGIPIGHGTQFCIHLAGPVALTMEGANHDLNPASDDRAHLEPALGLIGRSVAAARIDDGRLVLQLADGGHLSTTDDLWETHWPVTADGTEIWAPEQGPRFP